MYRADLHTHSTASPDGGLSAREYEQMLACGRLQAIAVTDHNCIDFAAELHQKLGNAIIVGEEITAQEGEIIGLYLREAIPAGLTAQETAKHIHEQGGLVYIPHPFETIRKGLPTDTLSVIADLVDIIETYNGRTLQNTNTAAKKWASEHSVLQASGSDAHGRRGWGNTANVLTAIPTRETLTQLLHTGTRDMTSTGLAGRLYPKLNRIRKLGKNA